MGIYNNYILPKVIDWACSQKPSRKQREKVVPAAYGQVLEIGIGTGLNLPYYDPERVDHVTGIDPSEKIWKAKKIEIATLPFNTEFICAFAEDIPADNKSFDTVVVTYTFCSIPDIHSALEEIKRVLKPNGQLLFCEHGKAPDQVIQKWQNFINPLWKQFSGGCSLNRDIPASILESGFRFEKIDSMYIPGWKPASFNYWGTARTK